MGHNRWPCAEEGCDSVVECNPKMYLSLWADGSWSVEGVEDEAADIICAGEAHDNYTPVLASSLAAFLDTLLPGTTWVGAKDGTVRDEVVTVVMRDEQLASLQNLAPEHLHGITVIKHGKVE